MSHQEEGGAVIKSGDATHSLSVKYCPAGDKYLVSRDGGPDQVCLLKRLIFTKSELELELELEALPSLLLSNISVYVLFLEFVLDLL